MPRSPIKRPPPSLDVSRTLRSIEQLPPKIHSDAIFGRTLPLEIEIGSGKGLFLSNAAASNPDHAFVGIEIMDKYAHHAAGRLAKANLQNALMISGNAEPILAERIDPESLEAVHVYFPDPWWKRKHRRRRVLNPTSVASIAKSLRVGGRFHFWTDVLDYFQSAVEMIAEVAPELGVPIPEEEIAAEHDLDYRTHFERRSRKSAIPVYRVRYEKRHHRRPDGSVRSD